MVVRPNRPNQQEIGLVNGFFESIDCQISNIIRWDRRYDWGFTSADYTEARKTRPRWPKRKLVAVVLVPYLETVRKTFDSLWTVITMRYESHWRDEAFNQARFIRLLKGIQHPGKRLRWEVIDLAANVSRSKERCVAPKDVRNIHSPHAGILAAAAHHSRWVQAMGNRCDEPPTVWLPGYKTRRGPPGWRTVPWLDFFFLNGQVRLGFDDEDEVISKSVPQFFSRKKSGRA